MWRPISSNFKATERQNCLGPQFAWGQVLAFQGTWRSRQSAQGLSCHFALSKTVFLPTSLKWSETLTKKYLKRAVRKTKRVSEDKMTHPHQACCGLQGSNPSFVKAQSKMSLPASALAVALQAVLTQLQMYLWRMGEVVGNFCWTIALCVKGFREEGTSNISNLTKEGHCKIHRHTHWLIKQTIGKGI